MTSKGKLDVGQRDLRRTVILNVSDGVRFSIFWKASQTGQKNEGIGRWVREVLEKHIFSYETRYLFPTASSYLVCGDDGLGAV